MTTSAMELDPADLLFGMDIADEEELEYFSSFLKMGLVPQEQIEQHTQQSLLRGVDEWYMELEHASAVRDNSPGYDHAQTYDQRILPFPPQLSFRDPASAGEPGDGGTGTGGRKVRKAPPKKSKPAKSARKTTISKAAMSDFWEEPGDTSMSVRRSEKINSKQGTPAKGDSKLNKITESSLEGAAGSPILGEDDFVANQRCNTGDTETPENGKDTQTSASNTSSHNEKGPTSPTKEKPLNPKPQRIYKSPFFGTTTPTKSPSDNAAKARAARGTISCLPIPPLGADHFGLIQEELASDPFRLLVAITFLIRTSGKSAIPVFRELMDRFPTPAAIAIADPAEITALMHPLGLSVVRTAKIQKHARLWLTNPPCKERRYLVKNYPNPGDGDFAIAGQEFGPEPDILRDGGGGGGGGDEEADAAGVAREKAVGYAWEIGHLTQGRYALDSWRIFCRDVLLGRAEDWKGGGREAEFQPEWMRTLPQDKELRACLRWMWMREGWGWDPQTGEREPLRDELRRAVDERRVGYDDFGSLVILQ